MSRSAVKTLVKYVDAVTREWIGWTFPPPWQAVEEAGWQPDELAAYCHRCGDSVGAGEATDSGCATCRSGAELSGGIGQGVVRLGPYVGPLRFWIAALKYQGWAEMGWHLGTLLGQQVRDAGLVDLTCAAIVPMPMPWQRRMYRGIDHTAVIAAAMARELGLPVVRALAKANGPPQVTLSPTDRRRSGRTGLRVVNWPWQRTLRGRSIILVDDVRTTGSTLKAAVRCLRTVQPDRVVCAVPGVSDSKARRERSHQAEGGLLAESHQGSSE